MKKLLPLLGLAAALAASTATAAPAIIATKTDAVAVDNNSNNKADPGDTLQYTVVIQNNGPGGATGVNFSDMFDPNTTFLNVLPIARADTYTTVGNTLLEVGVTASGNPAVKIAGNVLQNDLDFMDTLTVTAADAVGTAGGTVTMLSDGTFSYLPAVNFTGTDSFTYTIQDPLGESSTATVTITVQNRVWYVTTPNAGPGDGRSPSPFNNLAAAQAASSAGDTVFLHQGSGNHTDGIALKNNQQLIGQGVDLVVGGFTLVTATANPTLSNAAGNGVTLASGNAVRGLTISACGDNGIFGSGITGLSIDTCTVSNNGNDASFDEAGIKLLNLLGTASISNVTVSGSIENNLTVANTAGTLTSLTIANSTFQNNHATSGGDGVAIDASGTANMTVIVTGGTFTANRQDHFKANARDTAVLDVTFGGAGALKNTLSGGHPSALGQDILISSANSATLTFDVIGNEINGARLSAINLFQANNSTAGTRLAGTISGNTIGTTGVAGSGSSTANGINVAASGLGTATLLIAGNDIRQYSVHGILLTVGDTSATNNVSISGNTIKEPNGAFALNGIHLNAGTTAAGTPSVCLDIGGAGAAENDFVGAGNAGAGATDFRFRQRNGSTVRLPGYAGASTDTAAVIAYIQGRNTGTPTGIASTQAPGGGFVGGAACVQPLMATASGVDSTKSADSVASTMETSSIATKAGDQSNSSLLTDAALNGIVDAAVARWKSVGLTEAQAAAVCNTIFRVGQLPGSYLAESSAGLVRIDRDAAGHGWFVDPTPFDDQEFSLASTATRLTASEIGTPAGRIDLLTTVLHELGHAIGISDSYSAGARDSVMYGLLAKGERRLPIAGLSANAVPGSISGTHFQAAGINLSIGTLAVGETITIKIRVSINNPLPNGVCQVSNQGTVSGSNFSDVLTDDPDTAAVSDPTVTPVDGVAPTITTCAPAQSAFANATCQATVPDFTGNVVASDNCTAANALVTTQSPAAGTLVGPGQTIVTITVKDAANNSSTCDTTFTVTDNAPPTINCAAVAPQSANADANCGAVVPDVRALVRAQSSDNCTAQGALVVTQSPAEGSTVSGAGSHPIIVTVTDAANNSTTCSVGFSVIDNTAPTIACGAVAAQTANANGSCSATVPDVRALVRAQSSDNCTAQGALVVTQSPAEGSSVSGAGSHPITVTVTDAANQSTACIVSFSVIDNTPPSIQCPADIIVPGSGATVTFTVTATDNCDPNPAIVCKIGAMVITSPHTFPLGTSIVTCTATDASANPATCSFNVTVNTPPVAKCKNVTVLTGATCDANASVDDGSFDPDGDVITITQSPAGPYPVGNTTVMLTVTDSFGASSSCTATVTVTNPSPVVTITGPPSGSVYAVGTPIAFTGTFTDNAGDVHTAEWTFESNTQNFTQAGNVNETTGAITATRTFAQAGVFLVTLKVTDICGSNTTATTVSGLTAMVVVYDPDGGYVTGGGWITSPAGAYVADPGLSGQASFGFVSKYQHGANVPSGNTQFHFQAANFNFSSTSYEWLVIAGPRAQYKGLGTVNGSGNYGFLLTAIDGQVNGGGGVDKLRLKVWDRDNGDAVVYDNNIGANDNANPTTALGGGTIMIHP